MAIELRKNGQSIPDRLEEILNPMQILALHQLEHFGWELRFVRRPLFQDPVPVVFSTDGTKIGILEKDGMVNTDPNIQIRE